MSALDPEDFNQGLELILVCALVAFAAWMLMVIV